MTSSISLVHLNFLLHGALWTGILSLIAFLGGGVAGLVVALCRISPLAGLRWLTMLYIQLVQGTPLLVVLLLTYFGLPAFGFTLTPLAAVAISMTIYVSAYLGEIWRGAILAVPKAQWEAAECLALSRTQRMIKVILPQFVKIATPPTVGFSVQIIKNTSLASIVGFAELTRSGQLINNSIFEPFSIYIIVAVMYFFICYPISVLSRRLEHQAGN